MYASAGPAGWRGVVRLVADLGQSSTSDCTRMCVVKNRNLGCYRQKPKRATTQIRVQHTEQGHSYEFNVVRQRQGVPESSKECTRSAHTEQNAGWPRMNLHAWVQPWRSAAQRLRIKRKRLVHGEERQHQHEGSRDALCQLLQLGDHAQGCCTPPHQGVRWPLSGSSAIAGPFRSRLKNSHAFFFCQTTCAGQGLRSNVRTPSTQ